MSALLSISGLTAYYGDAQALFGVDLALEEGEMLALLGRNGMGKSTTINALFGLTPNRDGEITFDGARLNRLRSYRRARRGLALAPEGRRCFGPLSVFENITACARAGAGGDRWGWEKVVELFPRLGERREQPASTLSGGEQQMLAIARALATNPKLLVLDEATEGLAPTIRAEIWSTLRRLKAEGLSILVVDKMLSEILPVADRVVVLERGVSVWSGAAGEFDHGTRDRYLGV